MQTELGVRGGPSLSLFLARAQTILVIDVRLLWCGPDSIGSLVANGSLVVFSSARDVGLFCWFC